MAELGIENMHIASADDVVIEWLTNGQRDTLASLTARIIVAYEYAKQRSVTDEQGWTTMPSSQELRDFLNGNTP